MVFRVVNQAVIGENKTFHAPAVLSVGANVAFIILTALGFGEKSFPVPEFVTADGITLGVWNSCILIMVYCIGVLIRSFCAAWA